MEEHFLTGNMFSYQQIVDGMKFSIDQLDEQIKSIDKRMENTWMDLKEICENFAGEKFEGTLEAVDHFFISNILETSVCCEIGDSVGNACCKLNNFLKQNPGSESQVFNCLLTIQFKEGLNFPICFKNNDGLECDSRKSLFDGNESFNELFTLLQKHFLDQLLMDGMSEIHFKKKFSSLENEKAPLGNNYHQFFSFAMETNIENKAKCFQRLSLLSTSNHGLILFANSKSLKVKSKIEQMSTISDFIENGKIIMNMMDEDARFMRLCIEEDDIINFISTVYLDPLLFSVNLFVESLTTDGSLSSLKNESESSKKCPSHRGTNIKQKFKAEDQGSLKEDTINELLLLIGWLLEVDDVLMRMQESSLRCMVGQERSRVGWSENKAELKSALKNSAVDKKKQSSPPSLTSIFNWRPTFEKYSAMLLDSFDSKLKESNRNNFNSMSVPDSLRIKFPMFVVASRNSIEILEVVTKFSCFGKFINTTNKKMHERFLTSLNDVFSENVEMISKKIDKDITVETLIIISSGINLMEAHMKQFTSDLQLLNSSVVYYNDLLETSQKDLLGLIVTRFMDIITTSIWFEDVRDIHDDDVNDNTWKRDGDDEPEHWLQNWWLQVEWLWSLLSSNYTFEMTGKILMGCVRECMQTFAWYFASKRLEGKQIGTFVTNIRGILSRSLDLLLRCCRRSEELIDACSNDGDVHEVHMSCVALTTALLVSASPLNVLKEMYKQYSSRPKHGLQVDVVVGRECQWLSIVRGDWDLSRKTRLDQLNISTSYEIMFGMLEHYPFEKQHLVLQTMFLHDCHFTITILGRLMSLEEESYLKDDKKDGDGDGGGGIVLIIYSILSIIFNYGPGEEPVFEEVLVKMMKESGGVTIFKENSTLFKFMCRSFEPMILSMIWKSLKEMEMTTPVMSSSLMSEISYFSKDRLFCGCKPSDPEAIVISTDEENARWMKIFITELHANFHHLPFPVVRICFKQDEMDAGDDRQIFVIKVLLTTLRIVLNKSKISNLFNESQLNMMELISNKLRDLISSSSSAASSASSSSIENLRWLKDEFLEKMANLGREILKDRKDANDPGPASPKSHHSSLVYEILLQSVVANKSDKQSLDLITQFFVENYRLMKALFEIDGTSPASVNIKGTVGEELTNISFDFSSFKNGHFHLSRRNAGTVYNPLKSLEVFKHGELITPFTSWNLCSELDLGLTEVNFPNILQNRPEFRDGGMSNLDESMKEFLDTLIQNHIRNTS